MAKQGGPTGLLDSLDDKQRAGEKVPQHPFLPLFIIRTVLILLIIVVPFHGLALGWAEQYPSEGALFEAPDFDTTDDDEAAADTEDEEGQSAVTQMFTTIATILRFIYEPPVYTWLCYGLALGLGVLLLELIVTLIRLGMQARLFCHVRSNYVRVRTPHPLSGSVSGVKTQDERGEEIFRILHRVLDAEVHIGLQPYLTLTVTGEPEEPAQLGAVVGGGNIDNRDIWTGAFRKALSAQDAEVVVDDAPDPLRKIIEGEREAPAYLAWREFALLLGPEYPLRTPDEADMDMINNIAASVKTSTGVDITEVQVTIRPRTGLLESGAPWRKIGLIRYLKLRRKDILGVRTDSKVIEEKMQNPAIYDACIRVVVVAQNRRAAQIALKAMESALGQYASQSTSDNLQRFYKAYPSYGGSRKLKPRQARKMSAEAQDKGSTVLTRVTNSPVGRVLLSGVLGRLALFFGITGALVAGYFAGWFEPEAIERYASFTQQIDFQLLTYTGIGTALLLMALHVRSIRRSFIERVLARAPRIPPMPQLLLPMPSWWPMAILSSAEIGGLWHLPPHQVGNLVRWLPCRVLPSPPQAFTQDNPQRLVWGYARRNDGSLAPVGPTPSDLRKVTHLTAGMGAGKSRFLANQCEQFIQRGMGFCLLDGKGDDDGNLTTTVRKLIPQEQEDRVMIIDLLDAGWPVGINPLAGVQLDVPGGPDRVLGQIRSVFARLDPETWNRAPGMQQYLDMSTLLVVAGEPNPTLAHVSQALIDDGYRQRLLTRCKNREVLTFWQEIFPQTGDAQKSSRDALMRRFGMLLVPELTRFMTTQPTPFRMVDAMENDYIVLVPVPHITLGGLASAIGMLLFQSVVRGAFERPGDDQTRRDYPLIVDEFQVLVENGATQDVESAISQLRAQGIPAIYAHQALTQIGDLKDLMKINAMNRLILRTQEPDASEYARQYPNSGLSAADITGQDPLEHQYAMFVANGKPAGPLSMVPLMWPSPVDADMEPEPGLQHWQQELPAEQHPLDPFILRLVYTPIPDIFATVQELEKMPDDAWNFLKERWEVIRQHHRAYILDNPACIPDRMERQRWLSRLWVASPIALVAAEYGRIRAMIDPDGKAPDGREDKKGKRKKKQTGMQQKEIPEDTTESLRAEELV